MVNYPWFEEKSSQAGTSDMCAFSIKVESRYGKVAEIKQMLDFCKECAKNEIEAYVNKVSFNSKNRVCTIELESVTRGSFIEFKIKECALKTLSSFEWYGDIEHGPLPGSEPPGPNIRSMGLKK